MARDYKKRGSGRRKKKAASPWRLLAAGFAMGAIVAILAYQALQRSDTRVAEPLPEPATEPASAVADDPEPKPVAARPRRPVVTDDRFTFYEVLPNAEVVIPDTEEPLEENARIESVVDTQGVYVLQAGSFQAFADADRRKAELAMQGVESNIERVEIGDDTWHRVRIGPLVEVDEVNDLRTRIRMAGMDVMLLRVTSQ